MKTLGYRAFQENEVKHVKSNDMFSDENGITVYATPEDSLRTCDFDEKKVIALVEGIGESYTFDSEYYGYENMKNFHLIKVVKVLTEEEIIERAFVANEFGTEKIIKSYRLPEETLIKLSKKSEALSDAIDYYQRGKKDAFVAREKALVKVYGQNNNQGCKRK